jgi:Uma2 family endonuclease
MPDYDKIITDDGAPVDNAFVEKQYRLLTEPLCSNWAPPGGNPFIAVSDVGYFFAMNQPPLVPDVMLSLDVPPRTSLREREHRSYFIWVVGKPPDVVIEIVSDRRGGEEDEKMRAYARLGVRYYVIFDPDEELGHGVLRGFGIRHGNGYEPLDPAWLPGVGLGLRLWDGGFEGHRETWLRWCRQDGEVIPTGAERAEQESRRADDEKRRADDEKRRADQAQEAVRRLRDQLRALGHDLGE